MFLYNVLIFASSLLLALLLIFVKIYDLHVIVENKNEISITIIIIFCMLSLNFNVQTYVTSVDYSLVLAICNVYNKYLIVFVLSNEFIFELKLLTNLWLFNAQWTSYTLNQCKYLRKWYTDNERIWQCRTS